MLNHLTIQGRLVDDPIMRKAGETDFCSIRIACDQDYCAKGETPKTDFISCNAKGQKARFIGAFFKKGRMIILDGRIEDVQYTDKNGIERRDKELRVEDVHFGDSKPPEGTNKTGPEGTTTGTSDGPVEF